MGSCFAAKGALSERHTQGGDDERRIEDSMHGPPDDAASEQIQYGNQIQPALASEDATLP
jgi:hypothetical protein